jgi:hypothetical protein
VADGRETVALANTQPEMRNLAVPLLWPFTAADSDRRLPVVSRWCQKAPVSRRGFLVFHCLQEIWECAWKDSNLRLAV